MYIQLYLIFICKYFGFVSTQFQGCSLICVLQHHFCPCQIQPSKCIHTYIYKHIHVKILFVKRNNHSNPYTFIYLHVCSYDHNIHNNKEFLSSPLWISLLLCTLLWLPPSWCLVCLVLCFAFTCCVLLLSVLFGSFLWPFLCVRTPSRSNPLWECHHVGSLRAALLLCTTRMRS